MKLGVAGAAKATVISQYLSGIGIMVYTLMRYKQVCAIWKIRYLKKERIREIISFSMLTCIQQSVMNLSLIHISMIGLALEECRKLGINKVLMTCDKTNIGSAKSIMNNGGVLESEFEENGETCLLYTS